MKTAEDIYSDFSEWPIRWMGTEEDVPYGQGILQVMRPFIESLIADGLSVKTIKRHMNNLWLLGGEIIRDVSLNNEYDKILPFENVRKSIGPAGGKYCQHLDSGPELSSYDSTCRKLYYFLEGKKRCVRSPGSGNQ